jgi:hypothetical protein
MTGNYRVTAVSQAAGSAAAQEPVAPGPVAPPPGLPLAEPASEARREAVRARAAAARSLPVRVRVRKRRLPRGLSGANGGLRVVLLEHVELSPELYHPDLRRHRRPRRGCASDAAGGVDAATGANCAALAACCNAITDPNQKEDCQDIYSTVAASGNRACGQILDEFKAIDYCP